MVLQFETRQALPDITVVALIGSLAIGNSLLQAEDQLKGLIAKSAPRFVADLSRLDYIDSAGIGVLVMASGVLATAGGKLRVAGAVGRVAQLFEITHLNRIVSLHPDVSAAIASFAEEPAAAS